MRDRSRPQRSATPEQDQPRLSDRLSAADRSKLAGESDARRRLSGRDPREIGLVFKDRVWEYEVIRLDGNRYESCEFVECRMEFSAVEPVQMIGCNFIGCYWVLVGPAASTLQFLSALYHSGGDMTSIAEGYIEEIRSGEILTQRSK